jgi:SAM-dependent methyltransferase
VAPPEDPYNRRDLALVHHRGFGFPRACAPGILTLLDPVRSRNGLVLELGCGSGLLTAELTAAGHRVIATDASPAMLDLARSQPVGPHERYGTTATPSDTIRRVRRADCPRLCYGAWPSLAGRPSRPVRTLARRTVR